MMYPFDPDQEITVESAWSHAEVVDYHSQHVYGTVKMDCMPDSAPWPNIFKMRDIGKQLQAFAASGKLTYNALNYVIAVGNTKLFFLRGVDKPEIEPDCCPKCETVGEFRRTALICPTCKDILGGF